MKNSNKKSKRNFIKSIIPALSILMIIVAILLVVYTLDSKKFNKGRVTYNDEYTMHVLYLVMNEDEVPKDITIDKVFNPEYSEFPEGILTASSSIIPLTKKGEYLYGDLNLFTNPKLLEKETDYVFTMKNNNGEVIDGCEYDKDKNILKVPTSYFESNKVAPIQVEIQTLMKKSEITSLPVRVNLKRFITSKKNANNDALSGQTVINIGKFGPGKLIKKNVHIYVNNADSELDHRLYEIDDNKVVIGLTPLQIKEIDIKVDYALMGAFARSDDHQTSLANSETRKIKINQPINNSVGDEISIALSLGPGGDMEYCGDTDSCVVIGANNNKGYTSPEANWFYTYFPYTGSYPNITDYATYRYEGSSASQWAAPNYAYRVSLSSILRKIDSQLQRDSSTPLDPSGHSDWLAFYCIHSDEPDYIGNAPDVGIGGTFNFKARVIHKDSNSIVLYFVPQNTHSTQEAFAFLKFYWDTPVQHEYGLQVEKRASAIPVKNLTVYAVNINNSSDSHTAVTDSNGIATFDNLTQNAKYKIYENCNSVVEYPPGSGTTGTMASLDINCSYPDASHAFMGSSGNGITPVEKVNGSYPSTSLETFINSRIIHAGLAIKKTDDNGTPIGNLQITIYDKNNSNVHYTQTTNANGIATFNNIARNTNYYVYENCSSTVTYGSRSGSMESFDISCSYPSSNPYKGTNNNGVPSIDDYNGGSTGLYEISNAKYRHCAVVNKVKGPAQRPENNVGFTLRLNRNDCRNYPNGTEITRTTGSDGYATFVGLGNCTATSATVTIAPAYNASLIGSSSQNVSIIRSTVKVTNNSGIDYKGKHYAKGDTVVISDADWNTYKNSVEETCSKGSTSTFRDKGYLLAWKKVDNSKRNSNAPVPMGGVSFRVVGPSGLIRFNSTKVNYTDIEGTTKSCYEWTESNAISGTTNDVTTDSNGEVCIVNLPNAEDFTITENATSYYFNNEITLRSTEKFSDFSSSTYTNYPYLIDWIKKEYKNNKSSNNDASLRDATFTVVDSSNNAVKTKPNKETVYDQNGVSKSCYVVDLITSSNNTNSSFVSDNDGYVCIIGLKKGMTYTITESNTPKYYAFSNSKSTTETAKLVFRDSNTKRINNCPTEVEITKSTTELASASADYKAIIKEELQKLTFNIVDSENRVLNFVYNSTSGHYEYAVALSELTGQIYISHPELRLNSDLKIIADYLPEGTYKLREVSSVSCASNGGAANGSNCTCTNNTTNSGGTTEESGCSNMGYASVPDITFTVTKNNNGGAVTCDKTDNSVKVSITNKPTKVSLTKNDMYGYFTPGEEVKFENDEEVEAFDNITFRVRKQSTINQSGTSSDANSNFEWFYRTSSGNYRLDVLKRCSSEGQRVGGFTCTQNLHTNNGSLNIRHLCKCETYLIEEYEVPDGTVFILPKAENNTCAAGYLKVDKGGKIECHPVKTVKVCDCDDSDPESSPPVLIDNKPTKQVFIKKDIKYNTIITDQNTTFEVYLTTEEAANANRKCNPYNATSKANDCILVEFEKNRITDPDESNNSKAYRIAKDSTSASNKVTSLHVDERTGKLILRYLPSYIDREYVLYETKAPRGYDLPKGENAVTRFKVVKDTINVEISNVPNRPSKVLIGKYDTATGRLIPGFKFRVYKVNNYDPNLSAMMQSKGDALWFKTIRDGSYEYREAYDTNLITTCTNRSGAPCSNIANTLVDEEYSSKPMGENNVTVKEGQALIQYLDTNSYYVVEEVEAPEGYKLPEKESDRFTIFRIKESEDTSVETRIYNTENYFTFYKYDEYNNLKDGAVFKLQKLNKDKVYEDVPLDDVSTTDSKIYKVNSASTNYEMTTINGQATIYRLTEGQYRVLEVKAPEGYELPKKTYNVVTFLVDKKGNTYGSNIIANKKNTGRKLDVPVSEAELVIIPQTGQTVVKYGLIIAGILGLIGLLIYIRKKVSK